MRERDTPATVNAQGGKTRQTCITSSPFPMLRPCCTQETTYLQRPRLFEERDGFEAELGEGSTCPQRRTMQRRRALCGRTHPLRAGQS